MGFFQNLKNKMGIGGVKVELQIPGQAPKADGSIDGKIVLTTKSEQEVVSYKVKMIEEYTTGRGDDKKTKEFELGMCTGQATFAIAPGETKEIAFTLPYTILKSSNDELKEKGGALGTLGKMGAFAANEKSEYYVKADVDVKAAALDPGDKKPIKLV